MGRMADARKRARHGRGGEGAGRRSRRPSRRRPLRARLRAGPSPDPPPAEKTTSLGGPDEPLPTGPARPLAACPRPAWPPTSWPWPRRPPCPPLRAPAAPEPSPAAPLAEPRAPTTSRSSPPPCARSARRRRRPSTSPPSSSPARSTAWTCGWCRRSSASPRSRPCRARPAFIKGVINLRGRVIPVIDLKRKLGWARSTTGRQRADRGGEAARPPGRAAGGRRLPGAQGPGLQHRARARGGGGDRRRLHPRAWPSCGTGSSS